MPTAKYKEGDKVIVTKKLNGHHFEIGQEVTIIKVTSYNVRARANGVSWALTFNEIKSNKTKNKTMSTTSCGTTETKTKKAKVTAVETAQKPKRITPLKQFANWDINRSRYDDSVSFGCGAVRVEISDLHNVADALEAGLSKELKEFAQLKPTIDSLLGTNEQVKRFSEIYTKVKTAYTSAKTLASNASGRGYSIDTILDIEPYTLRRIAGRQPKKK